MDRSGIRREQPQWLSRSFPLAGATLSESTVRVSLGPNRQFLGDRGGGPGIFRAGFPVAEKAAEAGFVLFLAAGHRRTSSQGTIPFRRSPPKGPRSRR